MPNKLAKLDDIKHDVNASTTGIDAELTALLEDASAIAERVAGVEVGGLRRSVDRVFYPAPSSDRSRTIALPRRPLESIASIKLLYGPATDAEFTAEAALTADTDYWVESKELARVGLFNDWWRTGSRSNQIIATTGFADPNDAVGGDSIEPPRDLQRGVIAQAVQLYNLRRVHGLKDIKAGKASGAIEVADVHPLLEQAASRYRRPLL